MRLERISLQSLYIENFRPFSTRVSLQKIGNLNIITGPNNIGKSSVLLPLRRLTRLDERYVSKIAVPDGHGSFAHLHSARFLSEDLRGTEPATITLNLAIPDLPRFLAEKHLPPEADLPEIPSGPQEIEIKLEGRELFDINLTEESRQNIDFLLKKLNDPRIQFGEGDYRELAQELASLFASRILYVPAFRVAGKTYERPDMSLHQEQMFDGSALLAELMRWCLPDEKSGTPQNEDQLSKLNKEISSILEVEARVWPTASNHIHIKLGNDEPRRIEDLGQGINQIVGIVAGTMSLPHSPILLLEEPEVCLHPGLQRRLIEYLSKRDAQTFITTHSNHIIDAAATGVRIYMISHDPKSNAREVISIEESILEAIGSLGVTASSVAAATAVIWVEGPSDAIYIRHWLSCHARGALLREGRDFTFAFHGGSLLSHVGLETQMVNLFGVHPGFFLVADSDKKTESGGLGHPYLERLLEDPRLKERIWVTAPKEIEGYLSDEDISDTIPDPASGLYISLCERLQLLQIPSYLCEKKVLLAQKTVTRMKSRSRSIYGRADLVDRIDILVSFIEECRKRIPAVSAASKAAD